MANQIRVSPETMEQRAGQTDKQTQSLESVISSMDRLLATLKTEWEGDAVRGYEERYQKIKPVLKNARDLTEEMSKNLRATARIVRETDQQIASQFRK